MNGILIKNFIGLKAKMYAINGINKNIKKAKGTPKQYIKNNISYRDYENILFNEQISKININKIQSKNHRIYTINQDRIGLSPYDDKRYILKDSINTLAYRHYKTLNIF